MLNRSCDRCRTRKLGCSGGERCDQCISANSGCVYKERKTRVVKRKRQDTTSNTPFLPFLDSRGGGEEDQNSSAILIDDFPSSSSSHAQTISSTSSLSGTSYSKTSVASSVLAESIGSTSELKADDIDILLREARSAIGFSLEGCELLLNVGFRWRILPTIHGCIQVEAVIRYLELLFAKTEEEFDDTIHSTITIDQLILALLTLSATILFMPSFGIHADLLQSAQALSPQIENGDPSIRQRAIFSLANRLFHEQMNKHDYSLQGIQNIIVFTFHHTETQLTSEQLFDHALRCSTKLGLHRVEGFTALDETKVRIWWYLVTRNWLAGPDTWFYSIYPNQFSTRLPLNLEFSDFEWRYKKDNSQSVRRGWTIASYSLALISLAKVVRELVDIHNELNYTHHRSTFVETDTLSKRELFQGKIIENFKALANTLVWFYRMESKFDKNVAIANGFKFTQIGRVFIERWMLHQQIFHCFIELHEVESFVDQKIPATCLNLANHVLDTAESCSHHCSILSASSLPRKSLISAATVISFEILNKGNRFSDHEEEFKKVAIAIEKAKILKGDKESKDLKRLEALFHFWSKNMINSFHSETKQVMDQWKLKDAWMQGLRQENGCEISQAILEREGEQGTESMQTFKPNLSSILPAYQIETDDATLDTLWHQILADNDFLFQDTNQSFLSVE